MKFLLGVAILLSSMLGGFVLSHGHLLALWQPYEFLIITGCGFGSFVIANPKPVILASLKRTIGLLKPSPYNKKRCTDLLTFLYFLGTKVRKNGLMSLEEDLENPEKSELFKKFPEIFQNQTLSDFLIDNLRLLMLGALKPHDVDTMLEAELEVHSHELNTSADAMSKIADSMPGFGIVAAVLGIVITMSLIGGDPKLLGSHVAAALVGTFLGILCSYGLLGPVSAAITHDNTKEMAYMNCARLFLTNLTAGVAPQIVIEVARKSLPSLLRPSFAELEIALKGK